MLSSLIDIPPGYLRTPDAGCYLGMSGLTLEKYRTYRIGPAYCKNGGCVVYAVADLEDWARHGRVSSPSSGPRRLPIVRPCAGR